MAGMVPPVAIKIKIISNKAITSMVALKMGKGKVKVKVKDKDTPNKDILNRVILSRVILNRVILNRAILNKAILNKVTISKVTINKVILNRVILNRAILNRAILNRAILNRAILNKVILNKDNNTVIPNNKEIISMVILSNISNNRSQRLLKVLTLLLPWEALPGVLWVPQGRHTPLSNMLPIHPIHQ
jgi:hypothetical protein